MQLINRSIQVLLITLFAVPLSAYAESWSCSHGNDVREVHIERPTSSSVPCNVVYKKQTEGVEDQALWSAENDDSYCEEKAQGFVAKLESWGWVCAETVSDEIDTDNEVEETVNDEIDTANEVEEATTANEADTSSNESDTATESTP